MQNMTGQELTCTLANDSQALVMEISWVAAINIIHVYKTQCLGGILSYYGILMPTFGRNVNWCLRPWSPDWFVYTSEFKEMFVTKLLSPFYLLSSKMTYSEHLLRTKITIKMVVSLFEKSLLKNKQVLEMYHIKFEHSCDVFSQLVILQRKRTTKN